MGCSAHLTARNRLVCGLLVLALPIALGVATMTATPAAPGHRLTIPPASRLADGDLVFRRGRDIAADAVLAQREHSHFSHVGMLVNTANGWQVIHATPPEHGQPGGVQAEPLEQFLADHQAAAAGFYRVDSLDRAKAREYLFAHLGRRFDVRFRYSDDTDYYCSELVLKALKNGGVDLAPGLTRTHALLLAEPVIVPDSLLASPRLHEIRP